MSSSTTSMPGPSSSSTSTNTTASSLNEDSSSQSRDSLSQQSGSESSSSSTLTRPTTPASATVLSSSILTPNSTLPQTSNYSSPSVITPPNQSTSINSIMNFIYPNYQSQQQHLSMEHSGNTSVLDTSSNMSVAAAISGASATLADEPELKKVKLAHFHFYQNQLFADNFKQANMQMSSKLISTPNSMSNNIYMVHKKLEERIGGILCCTVCLDLPQTVIYQVISFVKKIKQTKFFLHYKFIVVIIYN
jgi:hypothetical protein